MNTGKRIGLIAIVVLFLLQLAITGNMVYHQQEIVDKGALYKFRTAPIDPNDPFRGKYVRLNFEVNHAVSLDTTWLRNEEAYISLDEDENGFVAVKSISRQPPANESHYLMVKVNYVVKSTGLVYFNLPFDRFYMEESKAPKAEKIYAEVRRDTSQVAYAEVSIFDGEGVIQDVKIDGKSLQEIVENNDK